MVSLNTRKRLLGNMFNVQFSNADAEALIQQIKALESCFDFQKWVFVAHSQRSTEVTPGAMEA
jgi:hypothetical protein